MRTRLTDLAWAREELARREYPDDVDALLDELVLLDAPCPPMLGRALGYRGGRRFLAVYRTPDGSPRHTDGEQDGEVDRRAYVTLLGTREVRLPDTFYAEELDSVRAVLLDLEQLAVYHGSRRAIEHLVAGQPAFGGDSGVAELPAGPRIGCEQAGGTDVDELARWLADPTLYDEPL